MKMLYLAVERLARRCTRAYADWDLVINVNVNIFLYKKWKIIMYNN